MSNKLYVDTRVNRTLCSLRTHQNKRCPCNTYTHIYTNIFNTHNISIVAYSLLDLHRSKSVSYYIKLIVLFFNDVSV